MQDNYVGVLEDNRPQELKDRDFKSDNPELPSGAGQINWIEKTPEQWVKHEPRYQIWSSSCVAQAFCKACRTLGYDVLSAHPPYRGRTNFSGAGMWLWDCASLFKKTGTVKENVDPSQNLGEDVLNKDLTQEVQMALITNPYKIGGYVYLASLNFDSVAQAVQDFGHCIITVGSNNNEWTQIPTLNGQIQWHHCICITDLTLHNGKKYLVADDSIDSNTFPNNQRLLSEEFINQRITGGVYLIPAVPPEPIQHIFNKNLKKGMRDIDVKFLQERLKQEGLFPNMQTTSYFGDITFNAVKKYQLKYKSEILDPAGLSQPTGNVGIFTRNKLNQ